MILNTRPLENDHGLNKKLIKMGATVFKCPLIKLTPIPYKVWQANVNQLSEFDTCILTSPYAAKLFLHTLIKNHIKIPHHWTFVVIGANSARIIKQFITNSKIIIPQNADSESLCKLSYWEQSKRHVIYPEGLGGGRQLIHNFLANHGHNLNSFAIYKRTSKDLDYKIIAKNQINVILLTSELALRQFVKNINNIKQLCKCHILVFSKRLQKIGQDLHLPSTTIVEPDKLIDKLHQIAQTNNYGK